MKNTAILLFILIALLSCISDKIDNYDLSNADIQKIIDLQDRRDTKALIPYFVHDSKELRERACLAFASIQDSAVLESLYTMLEEDENIARAAALAVGQTGNISSVPRLKKVMERSMNEETRFEFLVALGKCGGVEENYFLASNYNVGKDARGTAWALFYLARKQQLNEAGMELALKILDNEKDQRVRLGAAQALMRSKLIKNSSTLLEFVENETDPEVKMALAGSLSGIEELALDKAIIDLMKSSDPNTQINFLHSFSGKESDQLVSYAKDLILSNSNINLKIEAATYLKSFPQIAREFLSENDIEELNWRVRATLLSAVVPMEADNQKANSFYQTTLSLYQDSENLYEKGELLGILGTLPGRTEWLKMEISKYDSIVQVYGMNALSGILGNDKEALKDSKEFLISNLDSRSPSLVTYSAYLLHDSVFIQEGIVEKLEEKRSNLDSPVFLEAKMELEKTISFLKGEDEILESNEFNHPILIDSLETLLAIKGFMVKTTKGDFFMESRANEAPGTVQSLAKLVKEGYYNGKLFHRVVPNFVIQTGCPFGDGWGGMDYTIRSEFSKLRYSTGAVGMASAGKDTESCQWFVNHSPIFHLNGRYTIFAYVVEGMDVVQDIEVGDRILSMEVVY